MGQCLSQARWRRKVKYRRLSFCKDGRLGNNRQLVFQLINLFLEFSFFCYLFFLLEQHGPKILQVAEVRIKKRSVCAKLTANTTDQQLCVGDGYPDICAGDSGGPLNCMRADGRNYLVGVASFAWTTCEKDGDPSVFARWKSIFYCFDFFKIFYLSLNLGFALLCRGSNISLPPSSHFFLFLWLNWISGCCSWKSKMVYLFLNSFPP